MDSIGPRLTGSPANRAANDWLLRTYKAWGVDAKNEQYGTWRDWTRGPSGLELVAPRARVLEATMHAWSARDAGRRRHRRRRDHSDARRRSATAPASRAGSRGVKGKLVLVEHAAADLPPRFRHSRSGPIRRVYHHAVALRDSAAADWSARFTAAHVQRAHARPRCSSAPASPACCRTRGRAAGASTRSSRRASTRVPSFDVSCEDYTLLARLAVERPASARARGRRGDARARRSRRCSTRSRASTDRRSRTSTSCSRRTSIRGTPAAARRTTAPARSRCSRRCAF